MFERVSGPVRGYFAAAYACPVGELGNRYVGYYKLFAGEPESYWQSECLSKGCTETDYEAPEDALNAAFAEAASDASNRPYLPTRLRARRADEPTLPLLSGMGEHHAA